MQLRSHFLAAFTLVATTGVFAPTSLTIGQELKSVLHESSTPTNTEKTLPLVPSLELSSFTTPIREGNETLAIEEADSSVETIRERFKDGRIRVERQVKLDSEGNYVNHGNYEEWSPNGNVLCSGTYEMGVRVGPWVRFHDTKASKLFTTQPYARFKPPFQSSVEFEDGEMHGVWAIIDAEQHVVSQIQLTRGVRNGQATWFYPNGQIMVQADYANGVLAGSFIEKSQDGKVIREDIYVNGQRAEVEKEYYAKKSLKSETHYLTAPQRPVSRDDWDAVALATYTAGGEKIKHGTYQLYFENGQLAQRGTFENGIATGNFESWHSNGEKAVVGTYEKGKQQGKWSWWHENGMRKSTATYLDGELNSEVLAWNEQGQRLTAKNSAQLISAPVQSAKRLAPVDDPVIR